MNEDRGRQARRKGGREGGRRKKKMEWMRIGGKRLKGGKWIKQSFIRNKFSKGKLTAIHLFLDRPRPFLHPGCKNVQSYMFTNQLRLQIRFEKWDCFRQQMSYLHCSNKEHYHVDTCIRYS